MAHKMSEFGGRIPDISEIAFVVSDLEAGVARYSAIFGINQWSLYQFEPPTLSNTTLYGDSYVHTYDIGLATAGDTVIEVIEPTDGESLFREHLRERGEGLHHIAYYPYEDPVTAKNDFVDAGMPIIQSGKYEETKFWFFDTRDELGVIFETATNIGDFPVPESMYSVGSDEWPF